MTLGRGRFNPSSIWAVFADKGITPRDMRGVTLADAMRMLNGMAVIANHVVAASKGLGSGGSSGPPPPEVIAGFEEALENAGH